MYKQIEEINNTDELKKIRESLIMIKDLNISEVDALIKKVEAQIYSIDRASIFNNARYNAIDLDECFAFFVVNDDSSIDFAKVKKNSITTSHYTSIQFIETYILDGQFHKMYDTDKLEFLCNKGGNEFSEKKYDIFPISAEDFYRLCWEFSINNDTHQTCRGILFDAMRKLFQK